MTPTHDNRVRQLVKRGLAPSVAERIVNETDEAMAGGRSGVMQPDEAARLAEVTEVDQERARQAWYYNPLVPARYRRILDARPVKRES